MLDFWSPKNLSRCFVFIAYGFVNLWSRIYCHDKNCEWSNTTQGFN